MGIINWIRNLGSDSPSTQLMLPGHEEPGNLRLHLDTFIVRWNARSGIYSQNVYPTAKVFTNLDDAIRFKEMLEHAYKILEITGENTSVKIEKK